MGLVPTFKMGDIRRYLAEKERQIERAIINTLAFLGEQAVTIARNQNTYRDQTGNLRNSIGYVIVVNGTIVRNNFRRSAKVTSAAGGKQTKGSSDGTVYGELLAEELAAKYSTGYALIVVAGMNYAAKVESRGLDVLTAAEQYAESNLPGLLKQLKETVRGK